MKEFIQWFASSCKKLPSLGNWLFLEHPKENGETYIQHLRGTLMMWLRLLFALMVLGIHAVLPGLFRKTTSNILREALDKRINETRH